MVKNLKKTVAQKVMVGKKSDNSAHKRKLISSIALACAFAVIIVSGTVYVAYSAFSASNCANMQSGTELCINSFTPDNGYATGGNWVTIEGSGFPSRTKTSDYVQDKLGAHYDGINNTGNGDLYHSNNTSIWKDLKSTNDLALTGNSNPANSWQANGYKLNSSATKDYWITSGNVTSNIPVGNPTITVEAVFINPAAMKAHSVITAIANKTDGCVSKRMFAQRYVSATNYLIMTGCAVDFGTNSATYGLDKPNTLHTATATFKNSTNDTVNTNGYIDGKLVENPTGRSASGTVSICNNTRTNCVISLGGLINESGVHADGYTLLSYRVYSKVLSDSEVKQNAEVDQNRFIEPPAVTIGGESCTNLEVLSETSMRCKVPKSTKPDSSAEKIAFEFGGATVVSENAYQYNESTVISVSPNAGSIQGKNTIVINGADFPYAAVTEYAQKGLVVQYDGIDNLGLGDINHSNTALSWKDLVGANDLTLKGNATPSNNWQSNGYKLGTADYWQTAELANSIPIGNHDRTVESIFINPQTMKAHAVITDIGATNVSCDTPTQGHFFAQRYTTTSYYVITGCGRDVSVNPTTYGLNKVNTLHTATSTYGTSITDASYTNGYIDGVKIAFPTRTAGTLNICANTLTNCAITLGMRAGETNVHSDGYQLLSYRLYDRILTEDEIIRNSYLDQLRFLAPPVVKIGTQTCTNVVVLSTTKLQCTVPQVQSASTENITVYDSTDTGFTNPKTLTQAYTYVDGNSMSITAIDPKVGPSFGGSKIRLTGKNLSISKVTIAGKDCTDPVLAEKTTYTCTVPEADITQDKFVDVVVIPNSGNNYVFAQGFQYIFARKRAVEFNVE
ncbi:MAG: IPT/TIG domain-containing protein [Bifidobacteriaceae bacterium]|jgi:hypothetical protein|nr:IPT/TIG domain-containing protein [Bifidobacteriaceae bacterium]